MKFKRFSIVLLVIGILLVVAAVGSVMIKYDNTTNVIIGGADMPTFRLFMIAMNGIQFCLVMFGAAFALTGLFGLIFRKSVKVFCTVKTTLLAVVMSVIGGLGLNCIMTWISIVAFNEVEKHPFAYPMSIGVGIASLIAFIVVGVYYLKIRKEKLSWQGIVIDALTSILYLPAFLFSFNFLIGF